jgi:hypothetical protein
LDNQKRTHPRVATRIEVRLRLPDGRTQSVAQILNMSLGGVFLEMDEPLGFGTELDLDFSVPGTNLRCKGLVVWNTRTAPDRASGRTGMGVRLMSIGVADMRKLEGFVAARLEGASNS